MYDNKIVPAGDAAPPASGDATAAPSPLADAAPLHGLSERLAEHLGRLIVSGQPAPGAAIPSEFELCASLGISRPALREGLRLLAAKGLIVTRRKLGTMVRPRADWNMLDAAVLTWHLEAAPADAFVTGLFELRHIVEPAVAGLAAARATASDIDAMAAALDDMARLAAASVDLVAADLRFHEVLLRSAGNPFLASFGAAVESALSASFRLSWDPAAQVVERSLAQHAAVLAAIRARQPDAAHAAMTALLDAAIENVRRALATRQQARPSP
ncbi:MAG: FadR/GntR family transcriptional regulator [Janthinobacterium lividum]